MKHKFRLWSSSTTFKTFQFLWRWNINSDRIDLPPIYLSIPLRMKRYGRNSIPFSPILSFQFLWGWNIRENYDAQVKMYYYFQFLWGWNFTDPDVRRKIQEHFQFLWGWNLKDGTVKKIEDYSFQFLWGWNLKTTLFLRLNSRRYFQFLWGWNRQGGKRATKCASLSFNSFEDETTSWKNLVREALSYFQFLWGWNI